MTFFRHLGFALWLALALVAGQHAALLHDLGHAAELAQKHDSKPGQSQCEKCFAFAQLTGAPTSAFEVPPVDCNVAALTIIHSSAPQRLALAFRSRAPPAGLA